MLQVIETVDELRRRHCPMCHLPVQMARLDSSTTASCPRCLLTFRLDVARAAATTARWDAFYDEVDLHTQLRRRRALEQLVVLIERRRRERGVWLDVGSGPGLLIDAAQMRGWDAIGIEPLPPHQPLRRFARVLEGTVEDRLRELSDLAVISFVDSLRYLAHPGAVLAQARDRLVDGGWLLVHESRARLQSRRRSRGRPIGAVPLQAWTPVALERALVELGFHQVRTLPSPLFLDGEDDQPHHAGWASALDLAAWPAARLVHALSLGSWTIGPNFVAVGRR